MIANQSSSNGLVYNYFENNGAIQTPVYTANHVRAAAGQDTFSSEFDNKDILECCRDIASKSRVTGNSIPFDFWVDYCPTHSQLEIWFQEKNATSSGVTLYEESDCNIGIEVDEGNLEDVRNWIKVYGSQVVYCPTNRDWWTEKDNDAAYQAIWKSTANTSIARSTTSDRVRAGSSCVQISIDDAAGDEYGYLDLDDADAYSATYTPDSDFFVSGKGIKLNSNYSIILNFWTFIDFTQTTDHYVRLELYGYTPGDVEEYITAVGVGGQKPQYADECQYGYLGSNIEDSCSECSVDIMKCVSVDEYPYLSRVVFDIPRNTDGTEDIFVDKLNFAFRNINYPYEILYSNPDAGTPHAKDATSIAAYKRRVMQHYDRTLLTHSEVDTMADRLRTQYKDPPTKYNICLNQARSDIDLGETFIINSGSRGLSNLTVRAMELQYDQNSMKIMAEKSTIYSDGLYSTLSGSIRGLNYGVNELKRR
jgi:hypothetical protein